MLLDLYLQSPSTPLPHLWCPCGTWNLIGYYSWYRGKTWWL